ncbi:MBL fold metallo-hydrolase [Paenibacillus sp. YYML68]|uniref:MBL fold metallo-hydrolase n=1 Tax=Paenibacillus sp. YYML68 TaxID=2909250 RepID=UPI0024924E90|nr:MBL fold metallo-hydrolase [Paenibacillus sp. YYML68]
MSLHIQFIGTGSAFAKAYYNTNALVRTESFSLLIDCGYTAARAMHELGIGLDEIDAILITHIHADHVGGLEEFAFQSMYRYKKRIRLLVPFDIKDSLWNHSLRGGLENAHEGLNRLEDYFDVVTLEPDTVITLQPELNVKLLPSLHIPGKPSYSLLLNDRFFYSADSQFNSEQLHQLHASGCKLMMHDCQLTSPGAVHASLEELLTLPEELQASIWLMHYSDSMPSFIGKTGKMTFVEQGTIYKLDYEV